MNVESSSVLSWLLTYAVHSTILLLLARLVSSRGPSATVRDIVWKTALVGGIVTASVQLAFDIRPAASLALSSATTGLTNTAAGNDEEPLPPADFRNPAGIAAPVAPAAAAADLAANGAVESSAEPAASESRLSLTTGIVLAWALVGLALAVVFGARRLILVGRLGDRRAVTSGPLVRILGSLQGEQPSLPVTLTSSNAISSPVALGLHEICVPEAALTQLDEDQQRGLLAHELAHLERRDPVWLDVAGVIERVFFFQPLNAMGRREMQMAAEHLCDERAATRLGSGVPLAKCLAQVAEWIQATPLGVPLAGMAEQRSQLVERISRLVRWSGDARPAPRIVMLVSSLAMIAGMIAAAPGVQARPRVESAGKAAAPADTNDRTDPSPSPSARGFVLTQDAEEVQDPAVITALIERLKDTDAGVRRAAASSLGNLGSPRAVSPLIAVLDDTDREVRSAAANALGSIHDPRAISALLKLIRDPSVSVRQAALEALDGYESGEVPGGPLVPALADVNADVRQKAARLIGSTHDVGAVASLMTVVRDRSPEVRAAAIEALTEIRDRSAASAILAALADENADVRHHAAHAVQELKLTVPEKTLLDLLGDSSADVRQAAIEVTRERPFAGAVAALTKLLDDPSGDVRVEAVSALGDIRDPAARRALQVALNSRDAKVRARAAEVLGERP